MKMPAVDKLAHMGMGLVILIALLPLGLVVAMVGVIIAGAGKEVADSSANDEAVALGKPLPHEVSVADAAWTILPALAAAVWLWLWFGVKFFPWAGV